MVDVQVPPADVRDVDVEAPHPGGPGRPDRPLAGGVLVADGDPGLDDAVHLLVVDVPLVPRVREREVGVGLERPPEHPAAHADDEVHPGEGGGHVGRGEPDVEGGVRAGRGGRAVDELRPRSGHRDRLRELLRLRHDVGARRGHALGDPGGDLGAMGGEDDGPHSGVVVAVARLAVVDLGGEKARGELEERTACQPICAVRQRAKKVVGIGSRTGIKRYRNVTEHTSQAVF